MAPEDKLIILAASVLELHPMAYTIVDLLMGKLNRGYPLSENDIQFITSVYEELINRV